MLDLFISSRNVFSLFLLGICVNRIWTEIVPVLFQIISPNAGERNNALPGWVPGGLQGFWWLQGFWLWAENEARSIWTALGWEGSGQFFLGLITSGNGASSKLCHEECRILATSQAFPLGLDFPSHLPPSSSCVDAVFPWRIKVCQILASVRSQCCQLRHPDTAQ